MKTYVLGNQGIGNVNVVHDQKHPGWSNTQTIDRVENCRKHGKHA